MYWESYSHKKIKEIVFGALEKNRDYRHNAVLGLPASFLDPDVFYHDAPFLKDAPFLSTMIANPNHIGCHTLNDSESAFEGTHQIEIELINLCAKEIFGGKEPAYDGYVASGGTEANIQAIWILKNYYQQAHDAQPDEIALVFSQDAHYSMPKAARLLSLQTVQLAVDTDTRAILKSSMKAIATAQERGVKHFIVIMNMGTTMFGSVDNIDQVGDWLDALGISYRMHVDAAYGGFVYPFATDHSSFTFDNPRINSFTLDGHKMLQSPYGTGMFITRTGFMEYALTEEANYVKGKDYTLVGSRSGANAIAVWMIMRTHGSDGWRAKVRKLLAKTDRLCEQLDDRRITYFRNPHMNIITIKAACIDPAVAHKFLLVPDRHDAPAWYKIVLMEHVTQGQIDQFLMEVHCPLNV
jgi:glutamate/tyrosine decarboxylase-like PLP-dependent enzyme